LEKEKLTIGQERDRQNQLLNTLKNDLHRMELERQELNMKVREKESLEERVRHWKTEIATMNARVKVFISILATFPYAWALNATWIGHRG